MPRQPEHLILVCYDIPDDKRRLKIAHALEDYGTRVQYSVFECILSDRLLARLQRRLDKLIDADEDSIRFYSLCNTCSDSIVIMGLGIMSKDEEFWII